MVIWSDSIIEGIQASFTKKNVQKIDQKHFKAFSVCFDLSLNIEPFLTISILNLCYIIILFIISMAIKNLFLGDADNNSIIIFNC